MVLPFRQFFRIIVTLFRDFVIGLLTLCSVASFRRKKWKCQSWIRTEPILFVQDFTYYNILLHLWKRYSDLNNIYQESSTVMKSRIAYIILLLMTFVFPSFSQNSYIDYEYVDGTKERNTIGTERFYCRYYQNEGSSYRIKSI